jgi:leader peptidase (prepilin peptidase) / N-methyltransferase
VNAVPVICALLAVPAGWASGVLIDRVPDRLALWPPPGIRVTGRYLACELVILGTFVALGYRLESAPALLIVGYLVLAAVLVTLSAIDIACFRLPDRIVLPALGVGTAIVVAESLRAGEPRRIAFALCGLGIYFGVLLVFHLISPAGMGFGDVKLAALMGLYLGWLAASYAAVFVLVVWALGIGAVTASVVGLILIAVQGLNRRTPIPFGPYLAFGTMLVVLLSPHLVTLKLSV